MTSDLQRLQGRESWPPSSESSPAPDHGRGRLEETIGGERTGEVHGAGRYRGEAEQEEGGRKWRETCRNKLGKFSGACLLSCAKTWKRLNCLCSATLVIVNGVVCSLIVSSCFSGGAVWNISFLPFVVDDRRQLPTFLSWSWSTYFLTFLAKLCAGERGFLCSS